MVELTFSFDTDLLQRKKKKWLKKLRLGKYVKSLRLAILGGSTTEELSDYLELFILAQGVGIKIYQSDFNAYEQEALFPSDELKAFKPEIIYIHTSSRNMGEWPKNASEVQVWLEGELGRYQQIWKHLHREFSCVILQNNFELPELQPMGQLDSFVKEGRSSLIHELNRAFAQASEKNETLQIHDLHALSSWFGLKDWYDSGLWFRTKIAMSMDAIPHLAYRLSSRIQAIRGYSHKVLVLDLDDTLWGGAIGEDGLEGIRLGPGNPEGEAHLQFQRYILSLKERGVILAVVSKNDLDVAQSAFEHPDCLLKLTDFSAFYANWENKSLNLKKISEDLALGLESFVFVDNSSFEREEVRTNCPQVMVLEVGDHIEDYTGILDRSGYFELGHPTTEDKQRQELYELRNEGEKLREKALSFEDFLEQLKMKASLSVFNSMEQQRITQLIQKTNQFNLTQLRLNSEEVRTRIDHPNFETLYARLEDRFGVHGLVSCISAKIDDQAKSAYVELFVMSCRVLKRGLEKVQMDQLVVQLKKRGVLSLSAKYIKSGKNSMVSQLYSQLGFSLMEEDDEGNTRWLLEDLNSYDLLNHHMQVETNDA